MMTHHLPHTYSTSLVNSMYNANISLSLKKAIGAEQTGQMNWGDTGLYLIKVLYLNTYF